MQEIYSHAKGYYSRDFIQQDGEVSGQQDVYLQKRHAFHISNQTDADPIPT